MNKYFVNIIKINYMNIYFSKDNEISYYDLYLHCSDGTSSAFCHIKGNDSSELKRLNININSYIYNRNNNERNLITVFPLINEDIQLIIIGKPILEGLKELSFLYIYENINELKKYEKNQKDKNNMERIEWKITEQESQQEMVSADGRWHVTKNQKGNQEPSFYLSNYDLLLSPHGSGTDYKQCFESFIADCDAFIEKIKEVREQARMHMDEMVKVAKELETHEN